MGDTAASAGLQSRAVLLQAALCVHQWFVAVMAIWNAPGVDM